MNRAAGWTGLALILLGGVVFLWKAVVLALPVVPSDPEGLWRVELEITARGSGRRGSVRAPLPASADGQVVFDERSVSDRLLFSIRTEDDQRTGVWSGRFRGIHEIVHGFRVQLTALEVPLPSGPAKAPPAEIRERFGGPSADFPAQAPEVATLLESLALPGEDDPAARLRTIFALASDEVATVPTGSDDALLTLAAREGSARGKTRLLVTLLRAAGIPARPVLGLRLRADATPLDAVWAEAWVDGNWIPLSATEGFFAARPGDLLVLRRGSLTEVEATGVEAVGHRYLALRERLRPDELAAMMVPPNPLLQNLSLYRLPVGTQSALRLLLVFPLGALVVAIFRNLVGVPTFGTFMPVLIALALRLTSLGIGLGLVGAVLGIGILGRLLLDRLRLLLVPRLSVLLCLVVLTVTVFAIVGRGFEQRDFFAGVLFPIVILTMLVERFSIVLAEEGLRQALIRAAWSVVVAMAAFPLFQSQVAEHLMFGFPELVICVMGLLVWIGGYTGYRISDLVRFRMFAQASGTAS